MKFYYLATESNEEGNFEIHHRECPKIPTFHKRIYLGPFNNAYEALEKTKISYPKATVCKEYVNQCMIPVFSEFLDSDSFNANP